jgi:hypothetical protein
MLSGEATNTYFIVFSWTRSRLEPTTYLTRGGRVNHYTTDEVTLQGIFQTLFAFKCFSDFKQDDIKKKLYKQ